MLFPGDAFSCASQASFLLQPPLSSRITLSVCRFRIQAGARKNFQGNTTTIQVIILLKWMHIHVPFCQFCLSKEIVVTICKEGDALCHVLLVFKMISRSYDTYGSSGIWLMLVYLSMSINSNSSNRVMKSRRSTAPPTRIFHKYSTRNVSNGQLLVLGYVQWV